MIQFDDFGAGRQKTQPHCIACEEMLTDALDGTLGAAEQTFFNQHLQTCVTCSERMGEAQRGAAWLEMLKTPRPEPSLELLERILAETAGESNLQSLPVADVLAAPSFVPPASHVLAFRPRWSGAGRSGSGRAGGGKSGAWPLGRLLLEPRLAMTAAMAFFSIALTLNLMGFRLNEMRASDLTPTGLRHSFYEESAQAVRYYDNLRVVHVVESRVEDLRQQNADQQMKLREHAPAAQQPVAPKDDENQKKDAPGPGTSKRETPAGAALTPVLASVLLWDEEGAWYERPNQPAAGE